MEALGTERCPRHRHAESKVECEGEDKSEQDREQLNWGSLAKRRLPWSAIEARRWECSDREVGGPEDDSPDT